MPGSATVVARLRLAIAVKKGAPRPDISTVAAVKATLLNAKSIISVDPAQGSVGGATLLALDKMGIANQARQDANAESSANGRKHVGLRRAAHDNCAGACHVIAPAAEFGVGTIVGERDDVVAGPVAAMLR